MRSFQELLRARQERSLLCVGLDPDGGKLPKGTFSRGDPRYWRPEDDVAMVEDGLVGFCCAIIDATAEFACAFKPNRAFFSDFGVAGRGALGKVITHIHHEHPDVPVIYDAKFGDIGKTNTGYAHEAFDQLGADAVTVHPYMGKKSLASFLDRKDRGVIVLCRTSNEGAGEFQDLCVDRMPLYQIVARRVATLWNANNNTGVVVGATVPSEMMRAVRDIVGDDLLILAPGIGAQGGDLEATLKAGMNSRKRGLLVSASSSIMHASSDEDYAAAARAEAKRLHTAIEDIRRIA